MPKGEGKTGQRRFLRISRVAMRFVEDEWGFCVEEQLETRITYLRAPYVVVLYHGRRSREVGAELSFSDDSRSYSLALVMALTDREASREFVLQSASSEKDLEIEVHRIAGLVRRYFAAVVHGGDDVRSRLEQEYRHAERRDEVRYCLRPRARKAFERKDFKEAAGWYSKMEDHLTKVERARLSYSIRKASES